MSSDFNKYLSRKAPDVNEVLKSYRKKSEHLNLDVYAKAGIQIQIKADGETIWINIDGVCAMRIFNPDEKKIEIEDNRK